MLLLSEATRALENLTEKTVIDGGNTIAHVHTVLLSAHPLSTERLRQDRDAASWAALWPGVATLGIRLVGSYRSL